MSKNTMWTRVKRTPVPEKELKARETNQNVLNSQQFKTLCSILSIQPTKRQASKFNNNKGLVYKNRNRRISDETST